MRCKSWVRTAIAELNKEGFSCFDLARDAVPKLSTLKQKIEAFKRSKTVIVLLTEKCLKNRTFQRDLDLLTADEIFQNGGNLHEKILPLWLDIVPIPASLSYVRPLDASSSRDIWWSRLVRAIDFDRVDAITNESDDEDLIQPMCDEFEHVTNKLKSLGSRQISNILHRPVFLELFHFLAQCADDRLLLSVMESYGVYIADKGVYPVKLRCSLESYVEGMTLDDLTSLYKRERDGPRGAWMYLDTSVGKWQRIEINMCLLWDLPCANFTETLFVKMPQVRDLVFVVHVDFKRFPDSSETVPKCGQCQFSRGLTGNDIKQEEVCLTLVLMKTMHINSCSYYFVPFCGPEEDALQEARELLSV